MIRLVRLPPRSLALGVLLLGLAGPAAAQPPRPDLFAVCVGVSKHADPILDKGVTYAAKDALDVAALLKAQQGKLFGRVDCVTLTDAQATRRNIEEALRRLHARAGPNDYVIVFLAGHGGPDTLGRYNFVPHDAHPLLPSTLLPGQPVRDALQKSAGRRFLVLDTCHAGGFMGAGTEFATLAACMAKEFSAEGMTFPNGNFTRAFVEALSGKADANRDGVVTLAELDAYVSERLQALTLGRQQFTMHRPASLQSRLPLAMVGPPAPAPVETGPAR
jgi:uncharacterized caspase-like protein